MIIRRLIVPLTMAVFAFHAIEARAQSALSAAPRNDPAFPPVDGAAPSAVIGGAQSGFPSSGAPPVGVGGFSQAGLPGGDDCMNGFVPLRQEAEQRGAMIKSASDRHAPPEETCKLIGKFAQSEIKMIKYVEAHAQQCGILAQVGEQMKTGHRNTENMLKKVCDAAKQPHPAKGLQIANRPRFLGKPIILEGLIFEGLGDHHILPEELS